jgi:hypothetical protein
LDRIFAALAFESAAKKTVMIHASPAGQRVSDYRGAATVLQTLLDAKMLIADNCVDALLAPIHHLL